MSPHDNNNSTKYDQKNLERISKPELGQPKTAEVVEYLF